MPFLSEKEVILFQGDSVTDCWRNRNDLNSLGGGYPLHIAGCVSAILMEHDFTFINKGVSGDRVKDLNNRWDTDCINLQPTVVSILIGINDTCQRGILLRDFHADYIHHRIDSYPAFGFRFSKLCG